MWRHLEAKVGTSEGGGKQWQPTPKKLPRMQCARAIPVVWLGSGSCQNRPSGWILMMTNDDVMCVLQDKNLVIINSCNTFQSILIDMWIVILLKNTVLFIPSLLNREYWVDLYRHCFWIVFQQCVVLLYALIFFFKVSLPVWYLDYPVISSFHILSNIICQS